MAEKSKLVERAKAIAQREYAGIEKCLLAYSGGLDSNVMVSVLQEIGIEVATLSLDLGQRGGTVEIEKRAKQVVKKHVSIDAKNDLVANCYKGIKANCLFEGHVNAGAFSRPIVAKYLVEIARKEKIGTVVHGSAGTGNDQFIMENALRVLGPELRVLAPVRDWDMKRDEEISYAKEKGLPVDHAKVKNFSADENLWARTIRQGSVLDQSEEIPEEVFLWTTNPKKAPDKPAFVEIAFDNGTPEKVAVLDEKKKVLRESVDVVGTLNEIAAAHGVGRLDAIEDKVIGLKVREAYECPAALTLLTAHKDLEKLTMTSSELDVKDYIDHLWNRLVHDGGWYTRLRRDLDAFIDSTQEAVDGTVMVELYKGGIHIKGRKSSHALYDLRMGSRDSKGVLNQKDARHFAKLYGLQDSIAFMVETD